MRWFRRLPVALLAAAIVGTLLFTIGASSSVITLTYAADADATIRADRPTRSYGTTSTLAADNSPVQDSLLRFTVTGVGNDVVTAATLRLYVTNASPVGGILYGVQDQTWTEGVTWATAPAADLTATTTVGKVAMSTWISFDVTSLIKGNGQYSMRIKSNSTDGAGYTSREGTSTQRPQLVVTKATTDDTTKPTATITAPTGGTVSGQTSVTVDAGDNIGVTSVDVAVDGTVIGFDTTAPYAVPWDTTQTPNETHALTAIAHDAAGNTGTSAPVSVWVSNDTTKPTATITAPTGGTVSGQTSVTVDAGDNIGVTLVEVAVGGTVIGSDTTAPYEVAWDTTKTPNGTRVLTAIAHDAAGNTGTSASVSVSVDNVVTDTPPTVPSGLRTTAVGPLQVALAWTASTDDNGVTSYEVFRDAAKVGTTTTTAFTDATVGAGATVSYTVVALDTTDQRSDPSAPLVVTTPPALTSFTFAAAGDHGANTTTAASLAALDASPAAFYLALGDMDYDQTLTDAAWCDYIHAGLPTKGPTFPFELVTGNHEQDPGPNGSILNHAACLPDRMGSTVGPGSTYGAEYSFDYPASAPLARVIMISPGLTVAGTTYHYVPGSPHYDWLANTIDAAHAAGIQWVIVGMHFPCLSAGRYSCAAGPELMNLLVSKRVDLILHGHEHSYQRSKQLALDPTTCPSIPASEYVPGCVADDGLDAIYPKGAGSVDVIAGTFGQGLYKTFPTDPEAPYFVKLDSTSHGFMQYTVTADRIDAAFTKIDGTLSDAFSIVAGATPSADRTAPTQPTGLIASTATPGRVDLSWIGSTDDATIRNYAIFRDGLSVGSATATTFSDPSVTSSVTYTYTVSAYDTAGNPSAMSTPVTVTVPVATTLTFAPEADATVRADAPTTNYGTSVKLETDGSPVKQDLIRFTVSGVGARAVTTAKLRLSCVDTSPSGGTFTIAASNNWTESTVNWNTAPAAGATVATLGQVVAGTTYEIDLSSLIHGDGTYTLRIVSSNGDGADYASKESAVASRPQLIVTTAT